MSRVLAKPLRYGFVFLGCIGVILLSLFIVFQTNTTKTDPVETGVVAPGVSVIKGGMVNVFLVSDGTTTVAIDSGDNPGLIKAGLEKLKMDPKTVSVVLLTHTDYDHIAGLGLFPKAKIYMSVAEQAMINGKVARMFGFIHNHLDRPFSKLKDGEIFNVSGIKVRAIATPGHTYGSMSYIINDHYLYTGDMIALQNRKARLFRWFNYSDALGRQSIAKTAKLHGITLLCTAHNGYTKDFPSAMKGW